MNSLSVIVPTLNCIDMLRAHIETMRPWLPLAKEVIVVDSHSEDGCADYARAHIDHPGLQVLSHPRGLYQSWNYGIARTTGDWVYVSTVGDEISESHMRALLEAGMGLQADVVISPPRFVGPDGKPVESMLWPVELLVDRHSLNEARQVPFMAALILSLRHLPMSVLGSSASNLYRGEHLRARPFPTEFSTIGDVAWGLRHLFDTRFAVVPGRGTTFRLHPKVYTPLNLERLDALCEDLRAEARRMLEQAKGRASQAERIDAIASLYWETVPAGKRAREAYRDMRQAPGAPWWLRSEGWGARGRKIAAQRDVTMREREVDQWLRESLGIG